MEFIECIETLKRDFSNDCCVQDNGTLLLGLQGEGEVKLPRKHVIPPLPSMELEWNVRLVHANRAGRMSGILHIKIFNQHIIVID